MDFFAWAYFSSFHLFHSFYSNNISLYGETAQFVFPFVNWGTFGLYPLFWLSWQLLLWTCICELVWMGFYCTWGVPSRRFAGSSGNPCLDVWRNHAPFAKAVVWSYHPHPHQQRWPLRILVFPRLCQYLLSALLVCDTHLGGDEVTPAVVFISMFVKTPSIFYYEFLDCVSCKETCLCLACPGAVLKLCGLIAEEVSVLNTGPLSGLRFANADTVIIFPMCSLTCGRVTAHLFGFFLLSCLVSKSLAKRLSLGLGSLPAKFSPRSSIVNFVLWFCS